MCTCVQCQKEEGANPGQLFLAFGPHQQGAAQFLPGTAGLKTYTVKVESFGNVLFSVTSVGRNFT